MKLVDAEIPREDEDAKDIVRPPRPARRRVYTSLIVTLSVLFGTVGIIYWRFPNRQSEVLSVVMEEHVKPAHVALDKPTGIELRAWSKGIFDRPVPFPEVKEGLVPETASLRELFRRDVAIVRYTLDGEIVTLAFRRVREASPRVHRRTEDGLYAVSWHCKKFNCTAVGQESSKEKWTKRLGA
ncbi:MAG: hypothetical protein JKY56_23125, partial [Kofleriaceae bacterium]|nr:hypothetical protein [Kofleriaceae bacterium]